jgi:uncharacterized membrane protein YeaQ/YmgE (transglycosylase-associated protein family)
MRRLGRAIAGSVRGGLIVSIAVGFVGALLGPWVARALKLPEPFMVTIGGQAFPILWSIIGAALFVAVIHLISRRVMTALPAGPRPHRPRCGRLLESFGQLRPRLTGSRPSSHDRDTRRMRCQ